MFCLHITHCLFLFMIFYYFIIRLKNKQFPIIMTHHYDFFFSLKYFTHLNIVNQCQFSFRKES